MLEANHKLLVTSNNGDLHIRAIHRPEKRQVTLVTHSDLGNHSVVMTTDEFYCMALKMKSAGEQMARLETSGQLALALRKAVGE